MKTSISILIVLMTFMAVWSACQFDVVNTVMAAVSVPLLILGHTLISSINETEK